MMEGARWLWLGGLEIGTRFGQCECEWGGLGIHVLLPRDVCARI